MCFFVDSLFSTQEISKAAFYILRVATKIRACAALKARNVNTLWENNPLMHEELFSAQGKKTVKEEGNFIPLVFIALDGIPPHPAQQEGIHIL